MKFSSTFPQDDASSGEGHAWLIAHPGRADQDALITLLKKRLDGRKDGHLCTRSHNDIIRGDIEANYPGKASRIWPVAVRECRPSGE